MMLPPWTSFWAHSQYAEMADADLPQLQRELNPYERFIVRFMFSGVKVAVLFALAIPIGVLYVLAELNPFWGMVGACALGLLAPLCLDIYFHRDRLR